MPVPSPQSRFPAGPVGLARPHWPLLLFSIPFVLSGLWLLAGGLRGLLGPDPGGDEVMQVAGGFIFTAMGSLVAWLAFHEGNSRRVRTELRARHPSEPWRWRADWAAGRISCAGRPAAFFMAVFATVWNVFCVLLLWMADGVALLFVAVFVVVAAGLAGYAGLLIWHWLRFGTATLELATLPGTPGGRLRGTVHRAGRVAPSGGFRATLSCIRFTTGENGSETVLWQEEGLVPAAALQMGPAGSAVPIDFPIPADARSSSVPEEASGILWRLQVRAEVPGVDWVAAFDVPVFAAGAGVPGALAAEPAAPVETLPADLASHLGPVLQPEAPMAQGRDRYTPGSPNQVLRREAGGVEIRLPPARNKARAAVVGAVTLVWSFFALLAWFAAPLLFGLAFMAAWILLLWISALLWLRRWRVLADLSGVRVRSSILGIGRTRRVATGEIEAIVPHVQGEFAGGALYDIEIRRRGARRVKAADGLRSKREAEWLCAALLAAVRGSRVGTP